jgi:hypothetical protein
MPAGFAHDAVHLSNRFDGWKLYPYARALDAAYEVRGHYLYRCEVGAAPELEIIRDRIYHYLAASTPVFEIRDGRYVHAMNQPRPLFELRPGEPFPRPDLDCRWLAAARHSADTALPASF